MKMLSRSIVFVLLVVFASCELPPLDKGTNCPESSVAEFTVSTDSCDIPCNIVLADKSKNASRYEWYVDNRLYSNDSLLKNINFTKSGTYVLKLVVSQNGLCEAFFNQPIYVSNRARFAESYNLSTSNNAPIAASELRSGKIQVLYKEGTNLQSMFVDNGGKFIAGTIKNIGTTIAFGSINTNSLTNGEFLLAGSTTPDAHVLKIDSTQNIAARPNLRFQFTGSANSIAQFAIPISGNETAIAGFRNANTPIVGFARINNSNMLKASPIVADDSALDYRGVSLADNGTNLFLLAQSKANNAGARIFSLSINGDYNRNFTINNLWYPRKIIALGAGQFAIIGQSNSLQSQLYYFDGTTVSTPTVLDMKTVCDIILDSSGKLLILGETNSGLRVAKLLPRGAISYDDFSRPPTASAIKCVSISQAQFGGFLILAQITTSAKQEVYLIKNY